MIRYITVIFFLLMVRDITAGTSTFKIYLMDTDGTHQERLTDGEGSDLNPSFSPDGTKIIFDSDRDGDKEIYVIDILNRKTIKLTDNSWEDFDPAWSPDGENIVFVSNRDGNNEIYLMNKNGGLQTRLTKNEIDDISPSWSSDSKTIAYVRHGMIYLMKIKSKSERKLTQGQTPTFSPDGEKIAFSQQGDICLIELKNKKVKRFETLDIEKEPTWAPGGKIIVFTYHSLDTELKTINIETNQIDFLTENYSSSCNPVYSPNGRKIAFCKDVLSHGLDEEDEDIRLLKQVLIKIQLFYHAPNKAITDKLLYEAIKGMVKGVKDNSLKLVGELPTITLLQNDRKIEILPQNGSTTINIDCFKQAFNFIKTNYKSISSRGLIYCAINEIIESLDDPFSKFTDQNSLFDTTVFMDMTGLNIEQDKTENIFVVTVVEESPGYKIGIRPGDKIIEINGESIIGKSKEDVSGKLMGTPGKYIAITIKRKGSRQRFIFPFGLFKEEYFKSQIIENKIGYVRITQFYPDVKEKLDKVLEEFRKAKIIGLILDLRNSSGIGYLVDEIAIVNRFLPPGSIIGSTKGGILQLEIPFKSDFGMNKFRLPIVVIINHSSLGGGEIIASALKENKIGILIGTNTYGRTSLQSKFLLLDGSRLLLTTSKWYTPVKNSIEEIGLTPDIFIEGQESQIQEAIKSIRKLAQERIATYTISHIYTTKDGLPINKINCLAIQENLLWIGTKDGLCCYNKSTGTWSTYTTKDGLSGNHITYIAAKDSEIWVVTKEGISRWDKELGWLPFIEGLQTEGFRNLGITKIEIEGKDEGLDGDNIWFGGIQGLWKFDRKRLEPVPEFQPVITQTPFIYTGVNGKACYSWTTKTEYPFIKEIETVSNCIWVVSSKGLFYYNPKREKWEHCPPPLTHTYPSKYIFTDSSPFSILFLPLNLLNVVFNVLGGSDERISGMSLDEYKNMWLTSFQTLYYFNPHIQKSIRKIETDFDFSSIKSFNNCIWIISQGLFFPKSKVIQIDEEHLEVLYIYTVKDGLPEAYITSIVPDGNKIWLGTIGGGLILMEKK